MRLIAVCLFFLVLLIQYPLWFGKGGWTHVWHMEQEVTTEREHNQELISRNAHLQSEVDDLKNGTGAVEERARLELGMIKNDEVFVQILKSDAAIPPESSFDKMIQAAVPPEAEEHNKKSP